MKICYFINEDKKVVVANIPNAQHKLASNAFKILFKEVSKSFTDPVVAVNLTSILIGDAVQTVYLPKCIVSKSKCNPNDEYKEDIGKIIARKRAHYKYSKYLHKLVGSVSKNLYTLSGTVSQTTSNLGLDKINRELDLDNLHFEVIATCEPL